MMAPQPTVTAWEELLPLALLNAADFLPPALQPAPEANSIAVATATTPKETYPIQ